MCVSFDTDCTGSDFITDIQSECSSCSDNYYTTSSTCNVLSYGQRGNISVNNNSSVGDTSNICTICPYGAICTGNNVMPRPNYWGYWYEGGLVFLQCPAGYCCPGGASSTCNAYDYCAGNKTGTLCGACQDDFSVSILTGNCTPNSTCGSADWFWLFAVLVAMAYALWYTLKDDIFALLFSTVTYMSRLCSKSKSKIHIVKPVDGRNSVDNINENNEPVENKEDHKAQNDVNSKDEVNSDDDVDKGYFGIITYYVQMAAVITIQIEFSDIDKSESFLDKMVNNIGRFLNLELTNVL